MDAGARQQVRDVVRRTLAADCACDPDAFLRDEVTVVPFAPREGRRGYAVQQRRLSVMSMGTGVVVSCDAGRVPQFRELLGDLSRDEVFSALTIAELARAVEAEGQILHGPNLDYVCGESDLRPAEAPADIVLDVVTGAAVFDFYRYPDFPNALSYRRNSPTPDVLAVVASRASAVVGIAGASADSDTLWQIGVDVVPSEQGRGVARAIVSRLTQEVLRSGHLPFYATALANIASRSVAISLGYWPAWVEMNARDLRGPS
jgi:GNAT superfamily N-acetyltransferase